MSKMKKASIKAKLVFRFKNKVKAKVNIKIKWTILVNKWILNKLSLLRKRENQLEDLQEKEVKLKYLQLLKFNKYHK